jgi:branched-chain amino acid aminotransferase
MIPATDLGLIRGDGVFEVIRVYDGRPHAFEEHMARLERSSRNLRLPVDLEAIRADSHRLLAEAGTGPDHDLLRIVVTRGGRRLMLTEQLPELPARLRLKTTTYSPTRILDGIKSLSYAANMLASRLAQEEGFDEALLVTPHGRVLEAPTSSLFWVEGKTILTPPLDDHILASITRALVIEVTGAGEAECPLDRLREADAAFVASTAREVHPVSAIDQWTYDPEHPAIEEAGRRVEERIRSVLAV